MTHRDTYADQNWRIAATLAVTFGTAAIGWAVLAWQERRNTWFPNVTAED